MAQCIVNSDSLHQIEIHHGEIDQDARLKGLFVTCAFVGGAFLECLFTEMEKIKMILVCFPEVLRC